MLRQAAIGFTQEKTSLQNLFRVIGGSILIALFANISVPLPFSPVPISFQGHICLMLGALLGSRLGALTVLAYIAQGVMGLPVFALGKAGFPHL